MHPGICQTLCLGVDLNGFIQQSQLSLLSAALCGDGANLISKSRRAFLQLSLGLCDSESRHLYSLGALPKCLDGLGESCSILLFAVGAKRFAGSSF